MSKIRKTIFVCVVISVLAILASAILIFLTNKSIENIEGEMSVQTIDNRTYIVAPYSGNYQYEFKIEQNIDGEFVEIESITSKKNTLCLDDCNVNYAMGGTFRFSARWTNESGRVKSDFCDGYVWSATATLDGIDYSTVTFSGTTLSWEQVPLATGYVVTVVDADANSRTLTRQNCSANLSGFDGGVYYIYIVATADDMQDSFAGAGLQIEIEKQNVISNATISGDVLSLNSTEKIDKVALYAGETLLGYLENITAQRGDITFSGAETLLSLAGDETLYVKSLQTGYVLESELVEVAE